jgi:hypothetical protein
MSFFATNLSLRARSWALMEPHAAARSASDRNQPALNHPTALSYKERKKMYILVRNKAYYAIRRVLLFTMINSVKLSS